MSAIVPFVPADIEQAVSLAERLAKSALLPDALRGKPADVLVMIITGVELGLSPMQSIRGLHVIKGKAVMSADLQVALVKKHSDCVYFRLVETTDTRATYETERRGEQMTRMAFTIEQAKNAGLLGNDNWRKYPAAMLRARCSSALARAVYPDLTMGVYDEDEIPGAPRAERPVQSGPQVVEREVNEPPPLATQVAATGKRTAEVKAQLAARTTRDNTVPPSSPAGRAMASRIVEVKDGETEKQAEARQATPFEKIQALGQANGKTGDAMRSFVKGCGITKTKPDTFTDGDVIIVGAAFDALKAVKPPAVEVPLGVDDSAAPWADDVPPPSDEDFRP